MSHPKKEVSRMGKSKSGNIQGRKGKHFAEELKGISLDQILIVPIDAAKYHPKALICNYFGDILEESLLELRPPDIIIRKL